MRNIINEIEKKISNICVQEYRGNRWDENNISFRLVEALQTIFDGKQINYAHFKKKITFKAYKQSGKNETNYGDIAFLVNIQFSSGEILQGVAFLEAKRLFNSGYFESMDLNQLERLKLNAPYSQLLQYYPKEKNFILKFPEPSDYSSCMWVSPINTSHEIIKQLQLKDNHNIIRTSFPLSQFFIGRILWGKDLDYRKDLYDEVVNGIVSRVNPKYLCVLDTYYPDQKPTRTVVSDFWQKID